VARLDAGTLGTRARAIRLLLLDVDGVLTDGTVSMRGDGAERKSFFIRDGAGIVMAQRAGLRVGLLSGRPSEATSRRAAELGIAIVSQGGDKLEQYARILRETDVDNRQVAYMGDDLLDLPIFARAGIAGAPADAAEEVLAAAHWVSRFAGGRGAVRELTELLLRATGQWDAIIAGLSRHHAGV
jgi:3-deoxy-D-manno-octulosonate 8-phosphate phosphatase (KDO 8-P phosphatase)